MPSRRFSPFWVVALLLAAILVPTTLAASHGHYAFSTRNVFNDRRSPSPVRNLQVAAADDSSVTLDWSRAWDNVGVEGYGVYLDGARVTETPKTGYTLRDLACGRGYTAGVDAFDDAGNRSRKESMFVSTAACRDVTPPTTPTNVTTVESTETTVILSWSPSTDDFGVVGYGLYVGGFWVGRWSDPSATITDLSCGTSYEIGIDATDASGNSSPQTTAFFSTAPCTGTTPASTTTPASPTGLTVSAATTTTVTLAWNPPTATDVAEYGLYRDGAKVGTTSATTGDFGGLECGRTYTFGVDAADSGQHRSDATTISAATAPCPTTTPSDTQPTPPPVQPPAPQSQTSGPTAPPNLHTTSVTQSEVVLAWDSSTAQDGMAGYQIFRNSTKIGEGPGVHGGYTNTWKDTGRTCGTAYQYAVAGVDKSGTVGPKSTLAVTTATCDPTTTPSDTQPTPPPVQPASDTTAPSKPANVTVGTRTATSIALNWQPSTDNVGVTGYGLYKAGSRVGTTTSTTWIFGGLTCGTDYTLAIDATDAAGNRSTQAVVMVSTSACSDTQAPTAPTGLRASNVTQTGVTLNWGASSDNVGVAGYDLYRNGTKVATVNSLSTAQSGLTCGTAYTFAVAAFDAAGNHSTQSSLSATTAACSQTTSGNVVSLSGSVSPSTVSQKIAAAASGPVTVLGNATVTGSLQISRANVTLDGLNVDGVVTFTSSASGSRLMNGTGRGFDVRGADNVDIEGNTFDGKCQRAQNWVIEEPAGQVPNGTTIRNNTFRNYYMCSDSSAHTEALFIAYSDGGLIEGNTFEDNGTTSHVFFSYVGANGSLNTSNYARNWCVRGNTFLRAINPWYSIQFRPENPASANTNVDPTSNTSDRILIGPTTTEAAEHTKSC